MHNQRHVVSHKLIALAALWLGGQLGSVGCGRIGYDAQFRPEISVPDGASAAPDNDPPNVDNGLTDADTPLPGAADPDLNPDAPSADAGTEVVDAGTGVVDAGTGFVDIDEVYAGNPTADVTAPTQVRVHTTAQVSTVAGTVSGFVDGDATEARFRRPEGIAMDDAGNLLVADRNNQRVRSVSADGEVRTVAGTGETGFVDGAAESALFSQPEDVVVNAAGEVFLADASNHAIRRISPDGTVTTIAGTGVAGYVDGDGSIAQFNSPEGLSLDASGEVLVADTTNNVIRRIAADGTVTTVAGDGESDFTDGPADVAQFRAPEDIALDSSGAIIVADAANFAIRRISPDGVVDTLAGNGVAGFADGDAASAQFSRVDGLAVDAADNVLIADTFNHRVRLLTPTGTVVTIAGSGVRGLVDGDGASAQFTEPSSAVMDAGGNVLVCDERGHRLRRIVGGGPGRLGVQWELAVDDSGAPVRRHRADAFAPGRPTLGCEAPFGSTACTIAGLTSGVDYAVVVVAIDATGLAGPASDPVVITAP